MPVTVQINGNTPQAWTYPRSYSEEVLLQKTCPAEYERCEKILQSSFRRNMLHKNYITAAAHGFVSTMVSGYSSHYPVSMRPEDVWFAILTQLGCYIKAHSEELRSFFVAHEGKKDLIVIERGTVKTVNFGALAKRMARMIQDNVVDPTLHDWIMPAFSTTTDSDRVVASVLMMGSLEKYFTYGMKLTCGMPRVTLLGERSDWQEIYERLDKMTQLGEEPATFVALLKPVLQGFVASFDDPAAPDVVSFWSRAVDRDSGSGVDYYSGWISAFCLWDKDGKYLRKKESFRCGRSLELDGIEYHRAQSDKIPSGCMSVPVTIDDNGRVFPAMMVAGSVGIKASLASKEPHSSHPWTRLVRSNWGRTGTEVGPEAAIEPVTGWWIFAAKEE